MASCLIRSAAFYPIIIVGAFVFPEMTRGMIEASATRGPLIPFTRNLSFKKDILSGPILQVLVGWYIEVELVRANCNSSSSVCKLTPGSSSSDIFLAIGIACQIRRVTFRESMATWQS